VNRAQTLALGLIVALVVGASITGSPSLVLMIVPVLLLALIWTLRGSGRPMPETGWSTVGVAEDPVVRNGSRGNGGALATAGALGRVEGGLLFWSPWFAIGIGFSALIVLMFAVLFPGENNQAWAELVQMSPWFVHPLVGMVVVASHRAVTRSVRDGTEEVFGVCPTRPDTRTIGHLVAAWVPLVVAAVFLATFAAALLVRAPGLHGGLTADNVGDVVGALLLCLGGAALGVALGRWIRFGLVPIVAVVGVAFLSTGISGIGGHGWNPFVQLSTAPTIEAPSPVFADRPVTAHALWIAALTGIVAVVAVLRHRRDRLLLMVGGGAVALALVAGIGATSEMPAASAARIADLVSRPEAHQDCADLTGRVEVCVFPLHAEYLDRVVADASPVAAALPAEVGRVTIRQVYGRSTEQLPPEVRRRLILPLDDRPREIPLKEFDELGTFTGVRRDLAQFAVGLPTAPDDALMPMVAAGQARGVVALWLSVRGLERADQLRRTTVPNPDATDPFEQASLDGVGQCSVPSVVWSAQDLAAVRAMIDLDEEVVAAALESGWERWIDPTTGTDELLEAVGLPPAGPYDIIQPRPGEGC